VRAGEGGGEGMPKNRNDLLQGAINWQMRLFGVLKNDLLRGIDISEEEAEGKGRGG